MRTSIVVSCALMAVLAAHDAGAQEQGYTVDLASLGLRVSSLEPTDSVVTARRVLRARPGRQLVLATLEGSVERTVTLLSSPGLLAAHAGDGLVPATAFAIMTPTETRMNWVVASPPDTAGTPQLYAVARRGPVRVVALFDVPSSTETLTITVPQRQPGARVIAPSQPSR